MNLKILGIPQNGLSKNYCFMNQYLMSENCLQRYKNSSVVSWYSFWNVRYSNRHISVINMAANTHDYK